MNGEKLRVMACWLSLGMMCGLDAAAAVATETGSIKQIEFNIAAQPVESALLEFSEQADVQVMVGNVTLTGQMTKGVKGRLDVGSALQALLRDTGLKADASGRIVTITSSSSSVASAVRPLAQAGGSSPSMGEERGEDQKDGSQKDSSEEAEKDKISEIIVTAQKREERLQDVPISMSVLTGRELERSTASGVTEALSAVPGVAVNVQGQNGETQISMRGVTAGGAYANGASPIGYYIDGLPFSLVKSAVAPDANVYDLDRIEVLRGSQGTLYGAGGEGGLVRVLTNDANLSSFELKARASGSNTTYGGGNYRADMAINVPIVEDRLALRAVLGDQHLSGWLNSPNERGVNDADLESYRLKINGQPTNELSVALSAWRTDNHWGAPSWGDDNRNISDRNPLYPTINPQPISTVYNAYMAKVGYETDVFSLTSTSSYLKYKNEGTLDFRAQSFFVPAESFTQVKSKIFSEELLVSSSRASPWKWSGGIFYRDAKDDGSGSFEPLIPLLPAPANTSKSVAVFGEVGQRLPLQALEWSVGLRYFRDEVSTRDTNPQNPTFEESQTFSATTPRATLTWTPSRDTTIYASYSQGFRSGFSQDPTLHLLAPSFGPVRPDKLNTYEIGAKGTTPDRRLSYEGALYYLDWKGVQQQLTLIPPNSPIPGLLLPLGINGTSASGFGLDLAASARPISGLTFGLTFSWNNLELDEDVFSGGGLLFHKGDRLNYSPKYTAGASVEYQFPIRARYHGRLGASTNYTSPQDARNTSTPNFGDSVRLTRASFSVDSSDRWTGTLFVDNLNNWQGIVLKQFGINPIYDSRVRPRTVGVQLEYYFK